MHGKCRSKMSGQKQDTCSRQTASRAWQSIQDLHRTYIMKNKRKKDKTCQCRSTSYPILFQIIFYSLYNIMHFGKTTCLLFSFPVHHYNMAYDNLLSAFLHTFTFSVLPTDQKGHHHCLPPTRSLPLYSVPETLPESPLYRNCSIR